MVETWVRPLIVWFIYGFMQGEHEKLIEKQQKIELLHDDIFKHE